MKNYQIIEATIDKKALMMRVYTEGGFLVQLERGTEFSISFTRERRPEALRRARRCDPRSGDPRMKRDQI